MKRTLEVLAVTLILTAVAFAQRGGPNPANAVNALKEALNLSDAQLETINALNQTRRERAQAIFNDIEQKRQILNNLLDAASTDVTAVGNAAIALRASENRLKAEQTWHLAELKKLLTGEQQTKLDELIASRSAFLGPLGLGGRGAFGPGPRGRGPRL